MCKIFSSVLFLFIAIVSFGQNRQIEKKLDGLLTQQFKQNQPGCEVLVAKQGKIIYKKAFGSADIELNVPMKPDMVFNLASITKQFTAVAVMQLVEQGKISLHDSIQKYFPDFPSKKYTITIENLLTHTSGIKDYMQVDAPEPYMERWDFTPKQLIDVFKDFPLEFKPGTQFRYSNSGYALLGYIIEKVSSESYPEYIKEHILLPLGLNHTYYDTNNTIIPGRVNGYFKDKDGLKKADYWSPTIAYAAGGLISNVEDLYRWNRGLLSYKILDKKYLDKAFTPYQLSDGTSTNYGYGWYINTTNGIKSIEHSGAKNGFLSNEIYYPKQDIFIALLFNSENAPKDAISNSVSSIVLGTPLQNATQIADSVLNKYVGIYTLTTDSQKTIRIEKQNHSLNAKVSGQETYPLLFQSNTKFQFKNILDAQCKFNVVNGKVTGFDVEQHGHFEWKKTQ